MAVRMDIIAKGSTEACGLQGGVKSNLEKKGEILRNMQNPTMYEMPKLTPKQEEYLIAKNTMVQIETKYEPNRNPMYAVLHTKPFDVNQLSPDDKNEYMRAKLLVDKVANAQRKIVELEVKYEPNRDPMYAVLHTKPFDVNQLTPQEKREYMAAKEIIDTYIPKSKGLLLNC